MGYNHYDYIDDYNIYCSCMENRKYAQAQIWAIVVLLLFTMCRSEVTSTQQSSAEPVEVKDTTDRLPEVVYYDYDTSAWLEITESSGIIRDIKYATADNFTEKVIYDCGRCFLRPEISRKLIQLNKGIEHRYGLRLKVYDCYRPRPAQQKLWDIVPDARYVTPPHRGSMHNRGMAVDITLVDREGEELDMGTPYDFFGKDAHTDHNDLPEEVLKNRNILQTMMREIGFRTIRTEWWHFSYEGERAPLEEWVWNCD